MNRTLSLLFAGMMLVGWSLSAGAVRYAAGLNHAEWKLQLSPFECRMWQPIPQFGEAVFSSRAGEEEHFYLKSVGEAMEPGEAQLISRAPVWNESRPSQDLGTVEVRASRDRPVLLDKQRAYQLLNELYDGMSPAFSRSAWYADGEQVELLLSSVNFRKAYSRYQDCLVGLLPVNFQQISRSRLHFLADKFELTPDSKRRLANVVKYAKADASITGFYVDGHSDSAGRRLDNLELSKKRAEAVTRYLVAHGIDSSLITTRYHGERYPVVPNDSAQHRAANRRVTVRLERGGL